MTFMDSNNNRHHSHHHHHEHIDDAEMFKRSAFRSRRLRKLFAKVLFVVLCIVAVAIFAFLFWAIKTGE